MLPGPHSRTAESRRSSPYPRPSAGLKVRGMITFPAPPRSRSFSQSSRCSALDQQAWRGCRVLWAGVEPERQRTFPTPTYLSPILLGVKLRRMGERYVHATKFRSHCQPPSTVIDVRGCDPCRPPAPARDHPSGRAVPCGAPFLRAPAVVPQAPWTYLQRTTTRPEARPRAGRYDPTGCDRAGGPRRPGSAPWKPVETLTEPSNGPPSAEKR